MPNDPQSWLNVAQLAASVAGLLLTLWIALIVQRSSTRISQLEFTRSLQDSWIHIDDLTLRDDNLLRLANQFLPQRPGSSEGFAQKRIFLLAYLGPLSTAYQAARQGMYGSQGDEAIEAVKAHLALVVADEDGFWVTQNHGHDPAFKQLCREIHRTVAPTAA